ncbi:conserved protein, unknown function, partial [Hepatocystis sp. ex Piliocolobus tephrosceles]
LSINKDVQSCNYINRYCSSSYVHKFNNNTNKSYDSINISHNNNTSHGDSIIHGETYNNYNNNTYSKTDSNFKYGFKYNKKHDIINKNNKNNFSYYNENKLPFNYKYSYTNNYKINGINEHNNLNNINKQFNTNYNHNFINTNYFNPMDYSTSSSMGNNYIHTNNIGYNNNNIYYNNIGSYNKNISNMVNNASVNMNNNSSNYSSKDAYVSNNQNNNQNSNNQNSNQNSNNQNSNQNSNNQNNNNQNSNYDKIHISNNVIGAANLTNTNRHNINNKISNEKKEKIVLVNNKISNEKKVESKFIFCTYCEIDVKRDKLEEHNKTCHMKCPIDKCGEIYNVDDLDVHLLSHMKNEINEAILSSSKDIEIWLNERKLNYPTKRKILDNKNKNELTCTNKSGNNNKIKKPKGLIEELLYEKYCSAIGINIYKQKESQQSIFIPLLTKLSENNFKNIYDNNYYSMSTDHTTGTGINAETEKKKKKKNQKFNKPKNKLIDTLNIHRKSPLLYQLMKKEIYTYENTLMQCIEYITENNFFDDSYDEKRDIVVLKDV